MLAYHHMIMMNQPVFVEQRNKFPHNINKNFKLKKIKKCERLWNFDEFWKIEILSLCIHIFQYFYAEIVFSSHLKSFALLL